MNWVDYETSRFLVGADNAALRTEWQNVVHPAPVRTEEDVRGSWGTGYSAEAQQSAIMGLAGPMLVIPDESDPGTAEPPPGATGTAEPPPGPPPFDAPFD